jgi:hypothetical protein
MTAVNPQFLSWTGIKPALLKQIEKLRSDLEQVGMDPVTTEGIRGEIAGLRWLLRQAEPDAKIEEPTGTDYMRRPD